MSCAVSPLQEMFVVKIVTPAQFRQWIGAQQALQIKAAGSAQ
jgi:hypothetical protein